MVAASLIVMALLLVLGVPVAFALMASTILFFVFNDLDLTGFAHRTVLGSENFVLTAVPFFVLAAVIMNAGGLTRRLIAFADSLVGHSPGGLAQVNIGASVINSGITGSSLADCAGVGGVLIPEMVKRGYSPAFSAAVTASSAAIGPIIPPS
ncbi:MAG: TRAP transporter large permease subunit, partial [Acidobacteria bacterium]|nr:TRAP transporter large permease subunit [Acidobacteriota bacterium]